MVRRGVSLARVMTSTTIAPEALASALATLDRHGPQSPGELAAHERVQPPSMTRLLTRLEEAGLVTRQAHPTDGRQVIVSIAPEGRALLQASRARKDAWLAQRLAALTPADRETLRK